MTDLLSKMKSMFSKKFVLKIGYCLSAFLAFIMQKLLCESRGDLSFFDIWGYSATHNIYVCIVYLIVILTVMNFFIKSKICFIICPLLFAMCLIIDSSYYSLNIVGVFLTIIWLVLGILVCKLSKKSILKVIYLFCFIITLFFSTRVIYFDVYFWVSPPMDSSLRMFHVVTYLIVAITIINLYMRSKSCYIACPILQILNYIIAANCSSYNFAFQPHWILICMYLL